MALSQARLNFIASHKEDVVNATKGSGFFPSLKMAQMIIESADKNGIPGNGVTAVKAKNYFGIKANSTWSGEKMAFNTPKDGQPVNYFRVYKTVEDSIVDHTIFLKSNKRYTAAGVFAAKTPQTQAQCLQNAGYAEGAGYASKLNQIIKDYNLEILDTLEISSKKKIF